MFGRLLSARHLIPGSRNASLDSFRRCTEVRLGRREMVERPARRVVYLQIGVSRGFW